MSIAPAAMTRIGGHLQLIERLSSMVASELVVSDGFTEADALMAMAQVFISCGAHTACVAAREHLGRDPDYSKWKASCDAAFKRAVEKLASLEANVTHEAGA